VLFRSPQNPKTPSGFFQYMKIYLTDTCSANFQTSWSIYTELSFSLNASPLFT